MKIRKLAQYCSQPSTNYVSSVQDRKCSWVGTVFKLVSKNGGFQIKTLKTSTQCRCASRTNTVVNLLTVNQNKFAFANKFRNQYILSCWYLLSLTFQLVLLPLFLFFLMSVLFCPRIPPVLIPSTSNDSPCYV